MVVGMYTLLVLQEPSKLATGRKAKETDSKEKEDTHFSLNILTGVCFVVHLIHSCIRKQVNLDWARAPSSTPSLPRTLSTPRDAPSPTSPPVRLLRSTPSPRVSRRCCLSLYHLPIYYTPLVSDPVQLKAHKTRSTVDLFLLFFACHSLFLFSISSQSTDSYTFDKHPFPIAPIPVSCLLSYMRRERVCVSLNLFISGTGSRPVRLYICL